MSAPHASSRRKIEESSPATNDRLGRCAMRYLIFLLWLPALLVLYLSMHEEILSEKRSDMSQKPHLTAHAHHPR